MSKDKRLGRGLAALLGAQEELEPPPEQQEETPVFPFSQSEPVSEGEAESAPPAPIDSASPPAPNEADDDQGSAATESDPAAGATVEAADDSTAGASKLVYLNVYEIDDNPFQPRRDFSEPEIASLSESLKEHDMLQPVLVRQINDRFQLISGERRLRAAIQAGWKKVPAQIREASDRLVAELAIVENLQRKDLNPVEKALSFRRYLDEHDCKQEDLAQRLKIDRSTIANLMRLLELPDEVLQSLRAGTLSAGHARALLPLGDEPLQVDFCRRIRREGWSVREAERLVAEKIREEDGETPADDKKRKSTQKNQQIASLEQELRMALGAKVDIKQSTRRRGQIVIHFTSHDDFERLRQYLTDVGGDMREAS